MVLLSMRLDVLVLDASGQHPEPLPYRLRFVGVQLHVGSLCGHRDLSI